MLEERNGPPTLSRMHGELAVNEELGFEPGDAVEAPEQHGDAMRQRLLQRARRREVGDHALPEPLEIIGVFLRQHHVVGGRKAVAERVGRRRGLAGLGLRAGARLGVSAVGFDLSLCGHDGSFRIGRNGASWCPPVPTATAPWCGVKPPDMPPRSSARLALAWSLGNNPAPGGTMTAPENESGADPVTREIIRGKLLALADEMGIVIAKTSMSPVIYEVLDFACGLCDADGELVVQTNGITLFTGTFAPQVRSIVRRHGETMRPGDVFMTNDPFEGGTHSCDIALIKPIFVEGRLFAFAISVAHWSEVGGAVPGSISPTATEIYQEGVRFPGIRVCRDDETIDDVIALIRENVRLPVQSLGDFNAGLAAVRIAETRLREVLARYGERRGQGHLRPYPWRPASA